MPSAFVELAIVVVLLYSVAAVIVVRGGLLTSIRVALERSSLGTPSLLALFVVATGVPLSIAAVGSPAFGGYGQIPYGLGTIGFLVGLGLLGIAIGRYPEFRRVEAATDADARDSAPEDIVSLTGTVGADDGELLRSPHTDTPCVAYDARIETRLRDLLSGVRSWAIDDRRTDRRSFTLSDHSGTIVVDPERATLQLPVVDASEGNGWVGAHRRVLDGPGEGLDRPAARYSERRIGPGDTVTVIGRVDGGDASDEPRRLHADVVVTDPRYFALLRTTVVRNGLLGAGALCVGLLVVLVTTGTV